MLGIFTAINTFINIVTLEFSIEDILAAIVSVGGLYNEKQTYKI